MKVTISLPKAGWLVRMAGAAGQPLLFQYASRSQARYFAAVFRLRPRVFPSAHRSARNGHSRSHN